MLLLRQITQKQTTHSRQNDIVSRNLHESGLCRARTGFRTAVTLFAYNNNTDMEISVRISYAWPNGRYSLIHKLMNRTSF